MGLIRKTTNKAIIDIKLYCYFIEIIYNNHIKLYQDCYFIESNKMLQDGITFYFCAFALLYRVTRFASSQKLLKITFT